MANEMKVAARIASILVADDESARAVRPKLEAILRRALARKLRAESYEHWKEYLRGQQDLAEFELKHLKPTLQ